MKRAWKRFLKFIIESTAVVLVIYGVFSAGAHIKAKKDAIKQQELAQQEAQKEENKQEEPVIENKKLSEIELNEAMENLIEQYKGNNEIGIVYKNFSTGYRYAQEDKHYFTAASTVKVIYAMKIYDRIRNGEISKNADIAYNEKFLEEGNGQITNSQKKDSYKLEYVIQNMIQYSDNTATNMLVGNSATAADLVVKYLEDSEDGEWIKDGIPNKKIASKYGALETNYHDTAIVFGDKDYMLLIYTNNLSKSGQSIKNIAKKIDEITNNNM